jgi:crotonobetainyl-CoA:carnitine CoA-transferase CaiB-like acyl-CoA transferase
MFIKLPQIVKHFGGGCPWLDRWKASRSSNSAFGWRASGRSRAENAVGLIGELDEIFAAKPLDEWAKVFAGEPDFFWSPINSIEDVVADEQFHSAGGVVYVPDGDAGGPMVATPADFHGTPWAPRSAAPKLGEHTDEVLAELKARGA